MVRFDARSGSLYMTEMGRVASHYYIGHESVLVFNERLKPRMEDADIFFTMALCQEFESLQVRRPALANACVMHVVSRA